MENNEDFEKQQNHDRGFRKRGSIFGTILIFIGIVFLLQNFGLLSSDIWSEIWQFWPIVFILMGINMLLGRRSPITALLLIVGLIAAIFIFSSIISPRSNIKEEDFIKPLGDIGAVDARIQFGAGDIAISSLSEDSPNLVEAQLKTLGGANTSFKQIGSSGDLSISMEGRSFFWGGEKSDWNILLSRTPQLSLDFDSGASNANLDLTELNIKKINIEVGASDTDIKMPAKAGHVDAEISAGATNLDITIPEGVSAKIKKETGVSSFTVDDSRFPETEGFHISSDYDNAQNRVNLVIKAGVASVNVK